MDEATTLKLIVTPRNRYQVVSYSRTRNAKLPVDALERKYTEERKDSIGGEVQNVLERTTIFNVNRKAKAGLDKKAYKKMLFKALSRLDARGTTQNKIFV